MVGFTLVSRSYYYLRRRSPGPPFPPDHRQAGERGAIKAPVAFHGECRLQSALWLHRGMQHVLTQLDSTGQPLSAHTL
jgi:hypothetical protein